MRDPHVVALVYRLTSDKSVSFDSPPPVEAETDAFRVRLEGGSARFEMVEHHATEESARQQVEPYLRAWEMDAALRHYGRREIQFQFNDANVIDRDPPPPGGPRTVTMRGVGTLKVTGTATLHVIRRTYATPPEGFAVSPDVETLWNRYEGYLERREPLASMAYACLSFLQAVAGGRRAVARQYGVGESILRTLGRLAAEVGDARTARKFKPGRPPRQVTGAEQAWIEAAIKALIRRVGEYAYDPEAARPKLTMGDLPAL